MKLDALRLCNALLYAGVLSRAVFKIFILAADSANPILRSPEKRHGFAGGIFIAFIGLRLCFVCADAAKAENAQPFETSAGMVSRGFEVSDRAGAFPGFEAQKPSSDANRRIGLADAWLVANPLTVREGDTILPGDAGTSESTLVAAGRKSCESANGVVHQSGSIFTVTLSTTTGSTTPVVAICPYGGTQPTVTTVTQTYSCSNGVQIAIGSPTSTTTNVGSPTCQAPAPCGATASGSTTTQTVSTVVNSTTATLSQCPSGGSDAATTTTTQSYLCDNGTLTAVGSPVSTTTDSAPVCNTTADVITNTTADAVKAAAVTTNGACGSANGTISVGAPTAQLCSVGLASAVRASNGEWTWRCVGSTGTASCAAYTPGGAGMYPEVTYTCTTNYYVDSVAGSDSNKGSAPSAAWKTLQHAASAGVFSAGVCVNFAPNGSSNPYTVSSSGVELDSNSSGGSTADPGNLAVMRCNTASPGTLPAQPFLYYMTLGAQGSMPQCVIQGAGNTDSSSFILRIATMKYFVIDGFEITTTNSGGMENGLQVFTASSRDIWFVNNYVHDVGGQGAGAVGGDFYYFIGNVILRTALRNTFQESGLSFASLNNMNKNGSLDEVYGSVNGEAVHVVIANNVSALNEYILATGDSDGHGLIFDTVSGSQTNCGANGSAYSYGLLAYGNVAYGNGASAFHVFFANNAAFINNTAYFDYQDPDNQASARPEFFNQCGSNNIWANNIAYNIVGTGVFAPAYTLFDNSQGGTVSPYGTLGGGNTWINNMAYLSGTPVPTCFGLGVQNSGVCWFPSSESITSKVNGGTNSYNMNPLFNNPSLTPLVADFRLQPGSPALGAGTQALTALGGPVVKTPNIGAYQ